MEMVHSIPALRHVEFMRIGYAVEYDYVPPDQIHAWLETKRIEGLFHAGQINGTTGYEEAAAQGLMAGINAVLKIQGRQPLLLGRDQAYIGVLVDDLVTQEHYEPYRQMTSRAEYRLLLRQDNADLRLATAGYEVGLVSRERYEQIQSRRQAVQAELERLASVNISPNSGNREKLAALGLEPLTDGVNALQFLRRPQVSYDGGLYCQAATSGGAHETLGDPAHPDRLGLPSSQGAAHRGPPKTGALSASYLGAGSPHPGGQPRRHLAVVGAPGEGKQGVGPGMPGFYFPISDHGVIILAVTIS
jgi:glucose-inhibited division protein A